MLLLIKAALSNKKHYLLLVITAIAMGALMIGEYLEAISIGIISQAGSGFLQKSGEAVSAVPSLSKHTSSLTQIFDFFNRFFQLDTIGGLAIYIVSVALFKGVAFFANSYSSAVISIRVSRDLRSKYFEHIQRLSMDFYQKYPIGSLSARVTGDAAIIANSINFMLFNYLQTPIKMIATMSLCFFLSWKMSLLSFFALPLLGFPIIYFAKKVKKTAKQMQKNQENFSSSLVDFLAGIHTIKIFGTELFCSRKYNEENNLMARLQEKNARYTYLSRPIVHFISSTFLATIIIYGFYIAQMSLPEMLVFCASLYQFYEPIKKFNETNIEIQRGVAAAERMFEVLDIQPAIVDEKDAIELHEFHDTIEFDNVWFKYQDEWVLQGLNLTIQKGSITALVGSTGAGKSTIIQLLMRLYEVQQGEIRIDGVPITKYTQHSLKKFFSVVSQKPFLFLDTVAENIAFGQNLTEKEIKQAAERAHADEFICKLPQGYATVLAEAGKDLSGGQQQRLAIARALAKNSPVLVLDEATSSLDAFSESQIKQALTELPKEVTQLIIAHRLATIEHADQILFLENGRNIAQGSKDFLLDTCPQFRKLWELSHLSL